MARVNPFNFTKSWKRVNNGGLPFFPTHESNEDQVRSDMQQLFDEIKDFINNTLLGAVNQIDAADVTVTDGGTSLLSDKLAEIDDALEDLSDEIDAAAIGTIPDNSLTGVKIKDGEITGDKIDQGTIMQGNMHALSVGTPELIDSAVTTTKLADGAVTTAKITNGTVTMAKLDAALQTAVTQKYAVGDIFITTRSGNPNSLLGYGTWTQISDRFLLASGSNHPTVGETDGYETHTLTVDEMPSHAHRLGIKNADGTQTGGSKLPYEYNPKAIYYGDGDVIETTGGGQAHNNMPPYYVVNMWLRTA